MAIDRNAHPVSFDEAARVCFELANEIEADALQQRRIGDARPEVLRWTANRMRRLQFVFAED